MAQDGNGNSTEPPGGGNPFPAISETFVGAALVQTADARDLHRSLKVGRDFSSWIKARLAKFGFVENVDYVKAEVFAKSGENLGGRSVRSGVSPQTGENLGGRPATEYHLTLDTAKELAMVENNAQGRAVRRYFIECERRAKDGGVDAKVIGGVAKGVIRNAISEMMPGLLKTGLQIMLPEMVKQGIEIDERIAAVDFKPALSILIERKVPPRRRRAFSQKVSARLRRFSADNNFRTKISRETGRWLFHVDAINGWLVKEGERLIREHVDALMGQGTFRLVKP